MRQRQFITLPAAAIKTWIESRRAPVFTSFGFLAVFLAALAPSATASTFNLLTNGSLSDTSLTGSGAAFTYQDGNYVSKVDGWDFSSTNAANALGILYFTGTQNSDVIDQLGHFSLWPGVTNTIPDSSPDGGNFLVVDANVGYNASFSQTVSYLNPGSVYALTFYQAMGQQSTFFGPNSASWAVSFSDGTNIEQQNSGMMNDASQDFQLWNRQFMAFTATAATETVTFLAQSQPDSEPPMLFLDGVNLTETPEPASLAIGAIGLASLLFLRRSLTRR